MFPIARASIAQSGTHTRLATWALPTACTSTQSTVSRALAATVHRGCTTRYNSSDNRSGNRQQDSSRGGRGQSSGGRGGGGGRGGRGGRGDGRGDGRGRGGGRGGRGRGGGNEQNRGGSTRGRFNNKSWDGRTGGGRSSNRSPEFRFESSASFPPHPNWEPTEDNIFDYSDWDEDVDEPSREKYSKKNNDVQLTLIERVKESGLFGTYAAYVDRMTQQQPFDQVPAYSNPPSQLLTKKEWDREKRRLLNHIENIFPPRVLQDTGLVRLTTEAEDSINIGKEWPVAGRGNPEVLPDVNPFDLGSASSGWNVNTVVLQVKRTTNMKRGGRQHMMSVLTVAGNGNGAVGYAVGKAIEFPDAVRKSQERAASHVVAIDRRNGHTIHHDVHAKFGGTRVYMQYAPQGHGRVCHRSIWEICRLAGIHDVIANVKGSTTPVNVVRAAFMCLQMQGRDKIEQQSQEEGKAVLEYLAPELMPVLKIKAPPATVRHVVLPPREAKRLGQQWMFEFPLRPSTVNLEVARLLRHGLLLQEWHKQHLLDVPEAIEHALDVATRSAPALMTWLTRAPQSADLNGVALYGPRVPAEDVGNCHAYVEFDYDDDGMLYCDDVIDALERVQHSAPHHDTTAAMN